MAGLLLTGFVSRRAGLLDLLTRLLRWRVGARWYAVALLTSPLLATAVAAGLGGGLFVLWGAWHFLVNFWYSGANSGQLPLALFLTLYFLTGVAQLTACRIPMVWLTTGPKACSSRCSCT